MGTYNSFVFTGHGQINGGGYDPGAVNGSVEEHRLAQQIVDAARGYLSTTGLNILYGVNNYSNTLLSGHNITSNAGVSVHINSSSGASGVEVLVPSREGYLSQDFEFANSVSNKLRIPNRGVKSKNYDDDNFYQRTDGVKLNFVDWPREIRDAWGRGISLAILECGFIVNDLTAIQSNINYLGWCVASYICECCGVAAPQFNGGSSSGNTGSGNTGPGNTGSGNTGSGSGSVRRVIADGTQVGAYGNTDNLLNEVRKAVDAGVAKILIERV